MKKLISIFSMVAALALVSSSPLWAASTEKTYPDGHGGTVLLPQGDVSFADEVVAFNPGDPAAPAEFSVPEQCLGIPDYVVYDDDTDTGYLTLGCGGTVILRFSDNALVDIPGPDLYVFEIGGAVEPTDLAISVDGRKWIHVGEISGGAVSVDIEKFADAGEAYHYVRLRDLKSSCGGRWPGADIDAVAAIGSGLSVSFSSEVLFDFGKNILRPEAVSALEEAVSRISLYPGARIIVDGHTDSVGSDRANMSLSRKRAEAVMAFLKTHLEASDFSFKSRPFGESRPAASNDTEEGRKINRRVEVTIIPPYVAP